MFTLNPGGGGASSGGGSAGGWASFKPKFTFFGKLVAYYISLRLVHVYWGDKSPQIEG